MRKEYRLGEDLFLVAAALLIAASLVLALFDASFSLGLITVEPGKLLKLGVVSLLFNIALNVQELVHK